MSRLEWRKKPRDWGNTWRKNWRATSPRAIARRDVAIVSAIPGTTRDAIEVRCDLCGLPVTFVDTAGLRDTSDPIEIEGVYRTRAHIEQADLVLWLAAPDCGDSGDNPGLPAGVPGLRIGTKSDLAAPPAGADLTISAKT